jgi:hypothetical protein
VSFPIHIHRNAHRLGYRENFIRAAERCQGALIGFSDQDDIWEPQKLARCIDSFRDPDVLLVHHNATVFAENGSLAGRLYDTPRPDRAPPLSADPWHYGLGFTLMFRRALLSFMPYWERSLDHHHSEYAMAHDQWFPFLASVFGTTAYLDEPLVRYRQHGTNVFGWGPGRAQPGSSLPLADIARYRRLAAAADKRSEILEEIAQTSADADQRPRATAAALCFRQLERQYAMRSALYAAPSVLARARCVHALCRMGGYHNSDGWTLGRKGFLKDALIGIPFGGGGSRSG